MTASKDIYANFALFTKFMVLLKVKNLRVELKRMRCSYWAARQLVGRVFVSLLSDLAT